MSIEIRPTERLAIDGGAPLRTEPFGPCWIFGDAERRQLIEVMVNAPTGWRSQFKVREFADRFATIHGAHDINSAERFSR